MCGHQEILGKIERKSQFKDTILLVPYKAVFQLQMQRSFISSHDVSHSSQPNFIFPCEIKWVQTQRSSQSH